MCVCLHACIICVKTIKSNGNVYILLRYNGVSVEMRKNAKYSCNKLQSKEEAKGNEMNKMLKSGVSQSKRPK